MGEQQAGRKDIYDTLDALAREYLGSADLQRMAADPAHTARYRAMVLKKMLADPLLQRKAAEAQRRESIRRPGVYGSTPNTEPWMALAEQRMWVAMLAGDGMRFNIATGHPDDNPVQKRVRLMTQLLMSQTFLWSTAIWSVVHAYPLPQHVVGRDLLPYPFTFHSTEVAYDVLAPSTGTVHGIKLPADASIDWLAVADIPGRNGCTVSMPVVPFGAVPDECLIIQSGLHYGVTYPDGMSESEREGVRHLLSMFAFLRSPFVDVQARKLPRAWRRHGGVAAEDVERTVAVVELRQEARDAIEAYNAESKTFKHRWWVRGHIRRQWHPSTQSHELVWIAPFLKGPADAPLLDKVYAVRR